MTVRSDGDRPRSVSRQLVDPGYILLSNIYLLRAINREYPEKNQRYPLLYSGNNSRLIST